MKKFYLVIFLFVCVGKFTLTAQVLTVPQVIQEQTEWCWAGSTKCVLDYYGFPHDQCEIADYARSVITWHNFGTVNCCVDPSQGCNYWNYNYGYPGSMQDILVHFGSISNYGSGSYISTTSIQTQISAGRPFLIRWGWTAGGGHFLVGHGINDSDIYYMNPWFNEGLHIADYTWMQGDGTHTWTHTNVLTTSPSPTSVMTIDSQEDLLVVYPNPASQNIIITFPRQTGNAELIFSDLLGKKLKNMDASAPGGRVALDVSPFEKGIYFITLKTPEKSITKKILVN